MKFVPEATRLLVIGGGPGYFVMAPASIGSTIRGEVGAGEASAFFEK